MFLFFTWSFKEIVSWLVLHIISADTSEPLVEDRSSKNVLVRLYSPLLLMYALYVEAGSKGKAE